MTLFTNKNTCFHLFLYSLLSLFPANFIGAGSRKQILRLNLFIDISI